MQSPSHPTPLHPIFSKSPSISKASSVRSLTPSLKGLYLLEIFFIPKVSNPISEAPYISPSKSLSTITQLYSPHIHNVWCSLSARVVMNSDRFPNPQSQPTSANNHKHHNKFIMCRSCIYNSPTILPPWPTSLPGIYDPSSLIEYEPAQKIKV